MPLDPLDPYGPPQVNPEDDPYLRWAMNPLNGPPPVAAPQPVAAPPPEPDVKEPDNDADDQIEMPPDYVGRAPAPEQPAPDALTGGEVPEQQHDRFLSYFAGPPQIAGTQASADQILGMRPEDRRSALSTLTPDQMANAVQEGQTSPEETIRYAAQRQADLESKAREGMARIQAQDEQRARDDLQMQRDAVAKADADTKQLMVDANNVANTKINPQRYTQQRSLGKTIFDFVAVALSGAFMGATGGKNLALDALDKNIEQDIQAQKDDIENQYKGLGIRQNEIAKEYSRHGDLYKAAETYRVGAYQAAMNDLQTELANYDPKGATALSIRQQIDELHSRQAKAVQDFNTTQQKNTLDLMKGQAEYQEKMSSAAKNRAETMKIMGQLGGAGAVTPGSVPHSPDYYKGLNLPPPPTDMSPDAYKEWLTLSKQGQEVQNAQTEGESKAKEQALKDQETTVLEPTTGDPMVDERGQPIHRSNAKEINEKLTNTQKFVDATSRVVNALNEDPSTFDRKKWAEIEADLGTVRVGLMKDWGARVSSREDEVAKDMVSADFRSYLSRVKDKGPAIAALRALSKAAQGDLQTDKKGLAGIKTGSSVLDTALPPPAKKSDIDKLNETLSLTAPPGALPEFDFRDPDSVQAAGDAFSRARQTGMFKPHQDALDSLSEIVTSAKTTPEQKKQALGVLSQAMNNGPSDAIRKRATQILTDYNIAQTPGAQ